MDYVVHRMMRQTRKGPSTIWRRPPSRYLPRPLWSSLILPTSPPQRCLMMTMRGRTHSRDATLFIPAPFQAIQGPSKLSGRPPYRYPHSPLWSSLILPTSPTSQPPTPTQEVLADDQDEEVGPIERHALPPCPSGYSNPPFWRPTYPTPPPEPSRLKARTKHLPGLPLETPCTEPHPP